MYRFMEEENGLAVATKPAAEPDARSIISMRNIWKTYQMGTEQLHALRDVSFDVRKNEYVAIIGPSGSGKSTLMNLIGCLDSPTSGEYWINGHLVSEMEDDELARIRNKEIGFVFQTFNLVPYLTALENVQVPLFLNGVSEAEQRDRAVALLEQVGLGNRIDHKPSELSTGQQQRVALARTLANNPRLILADEPTGNLDPDSREAVLSMFDNFVREGRTIVMVTHDPAAAGRAVRRLCLSNGEVLEASDLDVKKAA